MAPDQLIMPVRKARRKRCRWVWLPQDEIGNSPSQPVPLNIGPYQNQMIHGDITYGSIQRVFAKQINGGYQGAVFRFPQGLEVGINRLVWGPNGPMGPCMRAV